jgi:hypothetical protein
MMNRSIRLIPLAALSAIPIAACGSTRHNATVASLPGGYHALSVASDAQPTASTGALSASRAAVACARQHGMPSVPDPVIGADGRVTIPGGTPVPTPAVRSACAAQIRAAQSAASEHAIESASDIQALLRVASCMRTHGYPRWPDPNERGEFHVKSADAGTPTQYNQAVTACDPLFPPSGWHLIVTPSGE